MSRVAMPLGVRSCGRRHRGHVAEAVWRAVGLAVSCGCLGVLIVVAYTASPLLTTLAISILIGLRQVLLVGRLRAVARTDQKTGLVNAGWWTELARRELRHARRSREPVAILIGDLDHFKLVNDTWGHLAADRFLVAVARGLVSGVRDRDVVGRFGGEEFVVLLPGTDHASASEVAERLRARVAAVAVPVSDESPDRSAVRATISIGVAAYPDHGADFDVLLQRADTALYQAKDAGRDRVGSPPAHVAGVPLSDIDAGRYA